MTLIWSTSIPYSVILALTFVNNCQKGKISSKSLISSHYFIQFALYNFFAGYGTTVPLSDEGRVFCVVYCLVGIPFTMLLLSCLTRALLPRVTHTPIQNLQVFWGLSRNHAALLHCSVLAFFTATLFFLLPAGALCLLEKHWSYLESLYFCFISLSTTGLGDYLPGRTQSQAARQVLELATSCKSQHFLLGFILKTCWMKHIFSVI